MAKIQGSGFRCAHQTSRGYGCLNMAKDGPFCPAHDANNHCGRKTASGGRCKRHAGKDGRPCALHGGVTW